jgi:uncharacterized protein involved in exopolysaccharide biosynthesis
VTQTAAKTQIEHVVPPGIDEPPLQEVSLEETRERQAKLLRLLWDSRRDLIRAAAVALVASTLIAFLIPKSYTSTAQLMPPDTQSSSRLAMMAAMASKVGGGLGSVAGDLLGMKRFAEGLCAHWEEIDDRHPDPTGRKHLDFGRP